MAAIETAFRHQHAVVWFANSVNADGETVVSPPIQLRVRWSKNIQELPDTEGKIILSQGMVVVDRSVPLNSILWEGRLSEWQLLDPTAPRDLMEVIRISQTPSISGRRFRRVLHLAFYKSKLPDVVGPL